MPAAMSQFLSWLLLKWLQKCSPEKWALEKLLGKKGFAETPCFGGFRHTRKQTKQSWDDSRVGGRLSILGANLRVFWPWRLSRFFMLNSHRPWHSPCSSARVALLFPGVAVGVITVTFPEAEAVVVEKHEAAHPFDAFPSIEMWNDQAQWAAVLTSERFAIVLEGEQDVGLQQIFERHVGGVALFGKN